MFVKGYKRLNLITRSSWDCCNNGCLQYMMREMSMFQELKKKN